MSKNETPRDHHTDLVKALIAILSSDQVGIRNRRKVSVTAIFKDAYGWYTASDVGRKKELHFQIKLLVREYRLTGNIPEKVSQFCALQLRFYSGKGALYNSGSGRKA